LLAEIMFMKMGSISERFGLKAAAHSLTNVVVIPDEVIQLTLVVVVVPAGGVAGSRV
jgi:hypothetical protein